MTDLMTQIYDNYLAQMDERFTKIHKKIDSGGHGAELKWSIA